MIVFFFNFFMKDYVVVIHYNHIVNEILIFTHSNSFYEEISKEFSDSFYCMPFLLGDRFTKDPQDSKGKTSEHNLLCSDYSRRK